MGGLAYPVGMSDALFAAWSGCGDRPFVSVFEPWQVDVALDAARPSVPHFSEVFVAIGSTPRAPGERDFLFEEYSHAVESLGESVGRP